MRRTITVALILGGIALMVVSYFFLATPWGSSQVSDSNPRVSFAPTLFVLGVVSVFLAAVVYELLPDRRKR